MSTPHTPDWVKRAVFYQIFPDRFARSSRTPHPRGISFKAWGAHPAEEGFQGGDLYGVAEKLDYLQELGGLGSEVCVTFSPHLIPMNRGILSTCYATLKQPMSAAEILDLYHDFYDGEPFIRVLAKGKLPRTKDTTGSNRCHIGLVVDERNQRLVAVSAIDNLTKGLAGAALQCLNLITGIPETTGLEFPGMWP